MTIRNSVCNFFDRNYFKNILRRTWSFGFISFIIIFASMPIPLLMEINGMKYNYYNFSYENLVKSVVEATSESMLYLWIVLFSAFAVIGGVMTYDFIINRKKAYLYHSLPAKRSEHFILNTLSACVWFFAAVSVNVAITFIVFAVNDLLVKEVLLTYMTSILRALVYFLLFLSVTALSSVLTGQLISTFVMGVVICFLPICIYLAFTSVIYYNAEYARMYDLSEFFVYITPVVRLFVTYDMPFTTLEIFVTLAVAIFLFFLSYFIYKERKIESAGTPIVYETVGEILKYAILFPLTFFSGLMFEAFGNGDAWLFFGFFFGAFVGLLFINLFLYRNPSKMFFRVKGFCIFLVLFIVFFALFGYNVFHHDRYIPNEKTVQSVTLYLDGDEVTFSDKELVGLIVNYADEMIEEDIEDYWGSDARHFGWNEFKIKTKLGATFQKRIPVCNVEETQDLYRALYLSEEYIETHEKEIRKTAQNINGKYYVYTNVSIIGHFQYYFDTDGNKLTEAYLADVRNPDRYSSPYICTIYRGDYAMRLYAADENSMNLIASYLGYENSEKMFEVFRDFAKKSLKEVTVSVGLNAIDEYYEIAAKEGKGDGYLENESVYTKTYTGEKAYEIYLSLLYTDDMRNAYTQPNAALDYTVTVKYEMDEEFYREFYLEHSNKTYEMGVDLNYPTYSNDGIYEFSTYMREDSIPSFVISDFSFANAN